MPIYEFACEQCGENFEKMVSMSNRDARTECPKCGSKKTGRKLSVVGVGKSSTPTLSSGGGGGHVHSGTCGCGRRPGSCGMGM